MNNQAAPKDFYRDEEVFPVPMRRVQTSRGGKTFVIDYEVGRENEAYAKVEQMEREALSRKRPKTGVTMLDVVELYSQIGENEIDDFGAIHHQFDFENE